MDANYIINYITEKHYAISKRSIHAVRLVGAVFARRSAIHRRQLLRHHRRERRGQIHLHQDTFRRAGADLRQRRARPEAPHVRPQAEPEPLRRLHRARHGHHRQPAALRLRQGEGRDIRKRGLHRRGRHPRGGA